MSFATLRPGSRLGRFAIEGTLGQGGMGVVYAARDEALDIPVALKVLPRELMGDARNTARFKREVLAATSVSHPNVVAVHFAGEEAGVLVMALELVRGGSLRDKLKKKGRFPWREAVRLGAEIARGLGAIHAAGLVHRDVKPANILLDEEGRPKLTDFGIARPGQGPGGGLTKTGEILGTLEYIAPEQAESAKDVDARADLYALGAVLHHMLAGKPPFEGHGIILVKKHLSDTPTSVSDIVPEVPKRLDKLVLALLAKSPADRPQTALEVATRLEAMSSEETGEGMPLTGASRGSRAPRIFFGVAVVAALATFGVAAALVLSGPEPTQPQPTSTPVSSVAPSAKPSPPPAPTELDPRRGFQEGKGFKLASTWGGYEWKHADGITTARFSKDEKRALTASYDRTAKIWDLATGKEIRSFPCPAAVMDAVFSPDETRVLLACADGRARVFDAGTGSPLRDFEAHPKAVNAVGWHPDGRTVLTAGGDEPPRLTLRRWDATTWKLVKELDLDDGFPSAIAFFADGKRAIVSGNGGKLVVYDLERDMEEQRYRDDEASRRLTAVAVTSDGRYAVTSSIEDGLGQRWDLEKARVKTFARIDWGAFGVALLEDGSRALVGGRTAVELWDLDPPRQVWSLPANWVSRGVALSRDGKRALTGHSDGTLRLRDCAAPPSELGKRAGFDGPVSTIIPTKDGPRGISIEEDVVQIRSTGGFEKVIRRDRMANAAALSLDGSLLLYHRNHGWSDPPHERVLVDLRTGASLWARRDVPYPIQSAAISEDGALAVSGSDDRVVRTYDMRTDREPVGGLVVGEAVLALAFLGGNTPRWIAGGDQGCVTVGDAGKMELQGKPLEPLGRHGSAVRVVAAFQDRFAVSGDQSGLVKLWDLRSKSFERDLATHARAVTALAFSPSGELVATASRDGTVRIFRKQSGEEAVRIDLASSGDYPSSLAFDGPSALVVGTGRGVVHCFALTIK